MAVLTKAEFITKYNGLFLDNTTGEISASDVREFTKDIADSFGLEGGSTGGVSLRLTTYENFTDLDADFPTPTDNMIVNLAELGADYIFRQGLTDNAGHVTNGGGWFRQESPAPEIFVYESIGDNDFSFDLGEALSEGYATFEGAPRVVVLSKNNGTLRVRDAMINGSPAIMQITENQKMYVFYRNEEGVYKYSSKSDGSKQNKVRATSSETSFNGVAFDSTTESGQVFKITAPVGAEFGLIYINELLADGFVATVHVDSPTIPVKWVDTQIMPTVNPFAEFLPDKSTIHISVVNGTAILSGNAAPADDLDKFQELTTNTPTVIGAQGNVNKARYYRLPDFASSGAVVNMQKNQNTITQNLFTIFNDSDSSDIVCNTTGSDAPSFVIRGDDTPTTASVLTLKPNDKAQFYYDPNSSFNIIVWVERAPVAGGVTSVNNTLTSTSTSQALSANQGRLLSESKESKHPNVITYTGNGNSELIGNLTLRFNTSINSLFTINGAQAQHVGKSGVMFNASETNTVTFAAAAGVTLKGKGFTLDPQEACSYYISTPTTIELYGALN